MDQWSDERKAAVVASVVTGEVSVREACDRFGLTPDRIREWVQVFRRSAHEALDQRLVDTLEKQGVSADELSAAELTGTLGEISLPDLIQTFQMGRKGGVVSVTEHGEVHRLWCVDGEVVDAESGSLEGEAAVYRILAKTSGRVLVDFKPATRLRTIRRSTQGLLLESARRNDESERVRCTLGDARTTYLPTPGVMSGEIEVAAERLSILRLFDGERTLSQVVAQSPLGDLETLEATAAMLDEGQLAASGRTSLAPVPPPPSSTAGLAIDEGDATTPLSTFFPQTATKPSPGVARGSRRRTVAIAALGLVAVGVLSFRLVGDGGLHDPSTADLDEQSTAAAIRTGATEVVAETPIEVRVGTATSLETGSDETTAEPTRGEPSAVTAPAPTTTPVVSTPPKRAARARPKTRRRRAARGARRREKRPRSSMASSTENDSRPAPAVAADAEEKVAPAAPRKPRLQVIDDALPEIQVVD